MHTKSSIHVLPVSGNSESHNLRIGKELKYVDYDKTHLNKSYMLEDKLHLIRERLEVNAKEITGRKMQAKATPIREGVVNLGKTQTMDDLKRLGKKVESKFGIKTLQIHIHEDEGHKRVKDGEWKQNRHAHMVFQWHDEKTGKSIKLKKSDMAEFQTLVSESLGMERGQSSDKKHLNSMAYKLQEMEKDALMLEKDLKKLKNNIKAQRYGEIAKKGLSETFKRLGGMNTAKKQLEDIKELKNTLNEVVENRDSIYEHAVNLKTENDKMKESLKGKEVLERRNSMLEHENKRIKEVEKSEKAWKNNFKLLVTGKVTMEQAKEHANKTGLTRNNNQNRGYSR